MSLQALYAASTGMDAQQTRIDVVANNLANLNTTGFKASGANFEDLMYTQVRTPGLLTNQDTTSPVGIQVGHGTRLVGISKNFSQGDFTQTNRDLDIAIEGNGFVQVTYNGNTAYTRDGSLRVDADGNLVTIAGYPIEPAITIPSDATSLSIGKDGTVSVVLQNDSTPQDLGQLQVAVFPNPGGLKALGQNLLVETQASGAPTVANPGESGAGTISQGFLETSNVNVAEELVTMIVAQRSYEASSKVLSTSNEMMQTANQVA